MRSDVMRRDVMRCDATRRDGVVVSRSSSGDPVVFAPLPLFLEFDSVRETIHHSFSDIPIHSCSGGGGCCSSRGIVARPGVLLRQCGDGRHGPRPEALARRKRIAEADGPVGTDVRVDALALLLVAPAPQVSRRGPGVSFRDADDVSPRGSPPAVGCRVTAGNLWLLLLLLFLFLLLLLLLLLLPLPLLL